MKYFYVSKLKRLIDYINQDPYGNKVGPVLCRLFVTTVICLLLLGDALISESAPIPVWGGYLISFSLVLTLAFFVTGILAVIERSYMNNQAIVGPFVWLLLPFAFLADLVISPFVKGEDSEPAHC